MYDKFRHIYKLLKALERAMDCDELDVEAVSAKGLGISENEWTALIEMLLDEGYIKGAKVYENIMGTTVRDVDRMKITLRGMEYLKENHLMKEAAETAIGIVKIIG